MKNSSLKQFHLITLVNIFIALIYFLLRYFLKVQGDFGEEPYSFQPYFQYAHIILVALWLFSFGQISSDHIKPKLKSKKRLKKKSGVTLICLSILMIVSGYLIQVGSISFNYTGVIHSGVSIVWILLYFWHK